MNKLIRSGIKFSLQELIKINQAPALNIARWLVPKWDHAIGSNWQSNVGTSVPSLPLSRDVNHSLTNAAVIYLARSRVDDLEQLSKSIFLLKTNFLDRYPYPIVIFHEDIASEQQEGLRSLAPGLISFEQIEFSPPTGISESELAALPWRLGYCHMCHFFSGELFNHPRIKSLDWYLRLDVDSYLLTPIAYDPFQSLETAGKSYGYLTTFYEDDSVCEGLAELVSSYVSERKIHPTFLNKHLDSRGLWDKTSFYTNFEITRTAFWRSAEFQDFWNYLNRDGGIYRHRWGDAPLHFIALALYGHEESIGHLTGIGYRHVNYYSIP